MRAVVHHEYGSPDVLQLEEVEKPIPKDDEVLIEVHAAAVPMAAVTALQGLRDKGRIQYCCRTCV